MEKQSDDINIKDFEDPKFIRILGSFIIFAVKIMAILLTIVVFWGLTDVIYRLYDQLISPPSTVFNADNMLVTLGSFLAVLIAIEIFLNVIFLLRRDSIHVPLVLATALTAVARKVIIFDYADASSTKLFAMAAIIFSIGIVYWLITRKSEGIEFHR